MSFQPQIFLKQPYGECYWVFVYFMYVRVSVLLPSRVRELEEPALEFQLKQPPEWSTRERLRTESRPSPGTRSASPAHHIYSKSSCFDDSHNISSTTSVTDLTVLRLNRKLCYLGLRIFKDNVLGRNIQTYGGFHYYIEVIVGHIILF